MFDGK